MNVLIVEPGKVPRRAEVKDDLAAMQEVVGGLIQAVYPFEDEVALICNDEGKVLGLPLNRCLRDDDGRIYDVIAGPFFLCGVPADRDHFVGLTEEQMLRYEERFRRVEIFLR